jgi:transcription initiation factor TFIIIB Brf1 subunit/transcription initiation factor TFIIB
VECIHEKKVYSGGFLVCTNCGLVDEDEPQLMPNTRQETISYINNAHLVDGLGSHMDYFRADYLYDANGAPLSPDAQKKFRRMRRIYEKIRVEGRDYHALKNLSNITTALQLSDTVRNRAVYIYRKLSEPANNSKPVKNRSILVAVSLYIAIKETKTPVTMQELVSACQDYGYKVTQKTLLRAAALQPFKVPVSTSEDFVHMYINRAVQSVSDKLTKRGWSPDKYRSELIRLTLFILSRVGSDKRRGRRPQTIAAAAIYGAAKILGKKKTERILTQEVLERTLGVDAFSIRDVYSSIIRPVCHYAQ